jgi:hypothetical protein
VGWHYCGAFLKNQGEFIAAVTRGNREIQQGVKTVK